jgi:peptide/nickel transport system permease protein
MSIHYVLKRLFWSAFVLWFVVSVVFVLMNTVGDPAAAQLGPKASQAQLALFRKQHGLDRPVGARYLETWKNLLRGDLGTSFRDGRQVSDVIATRLPRTMLLGAIAWALQIAIGIVLGTFAAAFRDTWFDRLTMASTFVGMSLPSFLVGLFLLDYAAFRLGWFPVGGYGVTPAEHVYHALLPALTLASLGYATYARVMRAELLDVLRSDYIRTARAKGASAVRVWLAHAVRTALLPVVSLAGMQLSILVSGAIITESVFGWPGMGRLAVESIYRPDYPMVLGVVIVGCAAVQIGNFLADLALGWLDPRVQQSS